MESALRFSYGTPLNMPLRVPSTVTTARATRVQFNSSHSSLSLSTGSTSRPIGHPFTPVINPFDRSSVPSVNKGAHKIVRGTVGVSRDLAYGFGVNGSTSRVNRQAVIKASTEPMDGHTGLKLLFVVTKCLTSITEEPSEVEVLFDVLKCLASNATNPSKQDVFKTKLDWKMKSVDWTVNSDGAAKELKKLRAEVVYERANDPHLAESMEMALVEFFICLGKFKEALDFINTLEDAKYIKNLDKDEDEDDEMHYETDKKRKYRLYKAIIYTMLGKKPEAAEWWLLYQSAAGKEIPRPS